MNDTVRPASKATSIGCPGGLPSRHHINGMRHGIHDMNDEFTEATCHIMAYAFCGINICYRTSTNWLASDFGSCHVELNGSATMVPTAP